MPLSLSTWVDMGHVATQDPGTLQARGGSSPRSLWVGRPCGW